jgi:hypothetical protein
LLVVHDALSDLGPGVFAGFEEAGVDEALAQGFVFEQAAFHSSWLLWVKNQILVKQCAQMLERRRLSFATNVWLTLLLTFPYQQSREYLSRFHGYAFRK